MKRALVAAWLCGGLGLGGVMGGCSLSGGGEVVSSREHLPVVGLTAASVYAEYGTPWAEQRWQTPIAQTIWKLVLPIGSVESRTASFGGEAWRAAYRSSGRGFAGDHGGGALAGATAAAMPASGYALADRTNTFSFASTTSGSSSATVMSQTQVAWDAKSLSSTHRFEHRSRGQALSGATQERVERPFLVVEAEATPEYLAPGDRTAWIIRVSNRGSGQARASALHVELPSGATAFEVEGVEGVEETDTGLVLSLGDVSVDSTLRVSVAFEVRSKSGVLAAVE